MVLICFAGPSLDFEDLWLGLGWFSVDLCDPQWAWVVVQLTYGGPQSSVGLGPWVSLSQSVGSSWGMRLWMVIGRSVGLSVGLDGSQSAYGGPRDLDGK